EQLNQKSASIAIIDEPQFHALLAPTLDELLELLRMGPAGIERINAFYANPRFMQNWPQMSGLDLSNMDLHGLRINCYNHTFADVDLSGANLSDTMLGFKNSGLDGATSHAAT